MMRSVAVFQFGLRARMDFSLPRKDKIIAIRRTGRVARMYLPACQVKGERLGAKRVLKI